MRNISASLHNASIAPIRTPIIKATIETSNPTNLTVLGGPTQTTGFMLRTTRLVNGDIIAAWSLSPGDYPASNTKNIYVSRITDASDPAQWNFNVASATVAVSDCANDSATHDPPPVANFDITAGGTSLAWSIYYVRYNVTTYMQVASTTNGGSSYSSSNLDTNSIGTFPGNYGEYTIKVTAQQPAYGSQNAGVGRVLVQTMTAVDPTTTPPTKARTKFYMYLTSVGTRRDVNIQTYTNKTADVYQTSDMNQFRAFHHLFLSPAALTDYYNGTIADVQSWHYLWDSPSVSTSQNVVSPRGDTIGSKSMVITSRCINGRLFLLLEVLQKPYYQPNTGLTDDDQIVKNAYMRYLGICYTDDGFNFSELKFLTKGSTRVSLPDGYPTQYVNMEYQGAYVYIYLNSLTANNHMLTRVAMDKDFWNYDLATPTSVDISRDIISVQKTSPSATGQQTMNVTLTNRNGQYNNQLSKGSKITVDVGFSGVGYDRFLTGYIDTLAYAYDKPNNSVTISCSDAFKKLEDWFPPQFNLIKSANRFYSSMKNLMELDKFVQYVGEWTAGANGASVASTTVGEAILISGTTPLYNCDVRVKISNISTSAVSEGLFVRFQESADGSKSAFKTWYLRYENSTGILQMGRIERSGGGSTSGRVLKTCAGSGTVSSLWLRLVCLGPLVVPYMSTDGISWSLLSENTGGLIWFNERDYADTGFSGSLFLPQGNAGIRVHVSATPGLGATYSDFQITELDYDRTVEEVIDAIATKAGIDDHFFGRVLADNFTDQTKTLSTYFNSAQALYGGSTAVSAGNLALYTSTGNKARLPSMQPVTATTYKYKINFGMQPFESTTSTAVVGAGFAFNANINLNDGYYVGIRNNSAISPSGMQFVFGSMAAGVETLMAASKPTYFAPSTFSFDKYYDNEIVVVDNMMSWYVDKLPVINTFFTPNVGSGYGYMGPYLAHDGATRSNYSYVFLQSLSEVIDVWNINSDENGEASIRNLAAGTNTRIWIDNDGILKAGIPINTTAVMTITPDLIDGGWTTNDSNIEVFSHCRVVGTDCHADYIDEGLVANREVGYKFRQFDYAELTTNAQCYAKAIEMVRTVQVALSQLNVSNMRPALILEVGDVVRFRDTNLGIDTDYMITDLSWQYAVASNSIDFSISSMGLSAVPLTKYIPETFTAAR